MDTNLLVSKSLSNGIVSNSHEDLDDFVLQLEDDLPNEGSCINGETKSPCKMVANKNEEVSGHRHIIENGLKLGIEIQDMIKTEEEHRQSNHDRINDANLSENISNSVVEAKPLEEEKLNLIIVKSSKLKRSTSCEVEELILQANVNSINVKSEIDVTETNSEFNINNLNPENKVPSETERSLVDKVPEVQMDVVIETPPTMTANDLVDIKIEVEDKSQVLTSETIIEEYVSIKKEEDGYESPISYVTDSHIDEKTDSHVDEKTSSHVDEKTDSRVDEITESRVDKKTSSCVDEKADSLFTEITDSHQYEKTKSHVDEKTNSHVDEITDSHQYGKTRSHIDEKTDSRVDKNTDSRVDENTNFIVEKSGFHDVEKSKAEEGYSDLQMTVCTDESPCEDSEQSINTDSMDYDDIDENFDADSFSDNCRELNRKRKSQDGDEDGCITSATNDSFNSTKKVKFSNEVEIQPNLVNGFKERFTLGNEDGRPLKKIKESHNQNNIVMNGHSIEDEVINIIKKKKPLDKNERMQARLQIFNSFYSKEDTITINRDVLEEMSLKKVAEYLSFSSEVALLRQRCKVLQNEEVRMLKTVNSLKKQLEDAKHIIKKLIDEKMSGQPWAQGVAPLRVTRSVGLQVCTVGSVNVISTKSKEKESLKLLRKRESIRSPKTVVQQTPTSTSNDRDIINSSVSTNNVYSSPRNDTIRTEDSIASTIQVNAPKAATMTPLRSDSTPIPKPIVASANTPLSASTPVSASSLNTSKRENIISRKESFSNNQSEKRSVSTLEATDLIDLTDDSPAVTSSTDICLGKQQKDLWSSKQQKDVTPLPKLQKDVCLLQPKDLGLTPKQHKDLGLIPKQNRDLGLIPKQNKDLYLVPKQQKDVYPFPKQEKDITPLLKQQKDVFPLPKQQKDLFPLPKKQQDLFSLSKQQKDLFPLPKQEKDVFPLPKQEKDVFPLPKQEKDIFPLPKPLMDFVPKPNPRMEGALLPKQNIHTAIPAKLSTTVLSIDKPGKSITVKPATTTTTTTSMDHLPKFPPSPKYPPETIKPPKPILRIGKNKSTEKQGIMLSWNFDAGVDISSIKEYQLYAFQEDKPTPQGEKPETVEKPETWKKVGDIKALPLPMACFLTQFVEGNKYHFIVRAVDHDKKLGDFSLPGSIVLHTKSPLTSTVTTSQSPSSTTDSKFN